MKKEEGKTKKENVVKRPLFSFLQPLFLPSLYLFFPLLVQTA
jgi:hypothetical protein